MGQIDFPPPSLVLTHAKYQAEAFYHFHPQREVISEAFEKAIAFAKERETDGTD